MAKIARFRLETLFDLILMILGVIILMVSWGYGFGTFRRPGPGLYPFFIGALVLFFSLILFILEMKPKKTESVFTKEGALIFILMIVTFCLWIVVMPLLGYVVVTFLATFAFGKIMKLEGWWKPLALSVGTAVFIYVLFDYWLYIDLPRGILG
jgi:putative tricarboxylic transport membrane protein